MLKLISWQNTSYSAINQVPTIIAFLLVPVLATLERLRLLINYPHSLHSSEWHPAGKIGRPNIKKTNLAIKVLSLYI